MAAARVHARSRRATSSGTATTTRTSARLKPGATHRSARSSRSTRSTRATSRRFPQLKPLLINAGFHTTVDAAAGHAGPRHQGDALSDVGRRAVRAADRLRQRREPRAGAVARAAEGAGDAPRARRRPRCASARQLVTESVILTLVSAAAGPAGRLRRAAAARHAEHPGAAARRGDPPRRRGRRLHARGRRGHRLRARADSGRQRAAGESDDRCCARKGGAAPRGRGARTLRRALVVAQVGFAFVLLIGAGLLFASFRQVLAVEPGFNRRRRADGVDHACRARDTPTTRR